MEKQSAKSLFQTKVVGADSVEQLLVAFESVIPQNVSDFGVSKEAGTSIRKARLIANEKAMEVLRRVDNPALLTEEEKAALRAYSGEGGIGGSTSEYYTPTFLAQGVWSALESYGVGSGNICEPSCGTGVFNATKPSGMIITGTEVSQTSSAINQLLHPEDKINNMPFEQLARETPDNYFDAFVGNVPFGDSRSEYANIDPEYKKTKTVEEYFVLRALDKVKPNGYCILVVPTQIVSSKKLTKFRRKVSVKGEFIGAHRIPSGTFSESGSAEVVTDVIVLRKHSEEMAGLIGNAKSPLLSESNVLWNTFILGNWFKEDGKKFIHGEVLEGAGNWGGDVVQIPNLPKVSEGNSRLTDEQLQQKKTAIDSHNVSIGKSLAKKFKSRIDWDLLETTEQPVANYVNGDRRVINGRRHELIDGHWSLVPISDKNGLFDKALYGAKSIEDIENSVSSASSALNLKFSQLINIHDTLKDKCSGQLVSIVKMANEEPVEHRERIVKGALIGSLIQDYLHAIDRGEESSTKLAVIQNLLTKMHAEMGSSLNVRGIGKLSGQDAALYRLFAAAMDKDGNFSDLISGRMVRKAIVIHDPTNELHVVEKLSIEGHRGNVSLEEFRAAFKGDLLGVDDKALLDRLSFFDNIAISPDGMLQPLDRATSGKIANKRAALVRAIAAGDVSEPIKRNMERQLGAIKSKRKWSSAKRINFGMRARWIPRQLVKDFLHENGLNRFNYVSVSRDDLGELIENDDYMMSDGIFTGYYTKNGKRLSASSKGLQFAAQLEKYLNGFEVRSKDNQAASGHRSRIRRLEKNFQRWMRQHADIDSVVMSYNDTFNGNTPFEHLDSDLGLEGISGEVIPMPYQNTAVRRLSEDGSGILALGTGLGKTYTALALVAFDMQSKRTRRTCIVVPKAVIENWINETVQFFGYDNLSSKLFLGYDLVKGEDDEYLTEPVKDGDTGKQKINKRTGNKVTRPVLRERSPEEISQLIHSVPHSDYSLVLMTKEQFARIPLKQITLIDNAGEHMDAHQSAGLIDAYAKNYRAQAKKEKLQEKLLNDGSKKAADFPYMEDLNFDKVIADEGHNYRNAQEAGNQARKYMYTSVGTEAQIAADMRQKMQYIMRKNGGRGAVHLTATPTPNSPLDAYNMLSHVMPPEEWHKIGIVNQDDFINEFGQVEEVVVNRLNGETAMAQGLTGFKNLDALRSLLKRWVNKKSADDVGADVKVPTVEDQISNVELSAEQKATYEQLRFRAELISLRAKGIDVYDNRTVEEIKLIERIEALYPADQLFSVIRDMDRVTSDIELYHGRMTFIFPKKKAAKAQEMLSSLPESKKVKVKDRDEHGELVERSATLNLNAEIKDNDDGLFVFTINDSFESELIKALSGFGLTQRDINHPLSPKYAETIELIKPALEAGGKILVFSEEKSQHKKLHRLFSHHLGLKPTEIGILNGDTVAGIASASNSDKHKKVTATQAKKLAAEGIEVEDEGLEAIARQYNAGDYKVLILNRKGEVGVNLHIGTSDVFHLTLPWNRSAVDQRTGRGARVGSPQEKVNSHFLIANGSFDVFRKDTIDRKSDWNGELWDGDSVTMVNAEAEGDLDVGALLSSDAEEYRAKQLEAQRELREKVLNEQKEDAQIDLFRFIEASKLASVSMAGVEQEEKALATKVANFKVAAEQALNKANVSKQKWIDAKSPDSIVDAGVMKAEFNIFAKDSREANQAFVRANALLAKKHKEIDLIAKAKQTVKQLLPEVEHAIEEKLVSIDKHVLISPSDYAVDGKQVYKVNGYYDVASYVSSKKVIIKITAIDVTNKSCSIEAVLGKLYSSTLSFREIGEELSYNEGEVEQLKQLNTLRYDAVAKLLTESELQNHLRQGNIKKDLNVYVYSYESFLRLPVEYLKEEDFSNVVYPDPSDEVLRTKVALAFIAKKVAGEKTEPLESLASALFGIGYYEIIGSYDDNKPTTEIVGAWLNSQRERVEEYHNRYKTTAIADESKAEYIQPMRSYLINLRSNLPTDSFSNEPYWQALKDYFAENTSRFESDYASHFKAMTDHNSKIMTSAINDSEEDIRSRLSSLNKSILSTRFTGFDVDGFIESLGNTPYDSIALLLADIISAGYEPSVIEGNNFEITHNTLEKAFRRTWTYMSNEPETLAKFILGEKVKEEVEAIATTADSVEVDSMGVIEYAHQLSELGVEVKRNSQPVEFKTRKGKVYRTEEEYSIVCFFDPNGKAGNLFKHKDALKSLCDAKYTVDLSPEFSGSWWAIKSSISTSLVLKAFNLD